MLFGEGAIQQPCYYRKISAFIVGGDNDSILVVLWRHRCLLSASVDLANQYRGNVEILNGGRRLAVTSSLKFTRAAARRQFVSPGAGELHRFGM